MYRGKARENNVDLTVRVLVCYVKVLDEENTLHLTPCLSMPYSVR